MERKYEKNTQWQRRKSQTTTMFINIVKSKSEARSTMTMQQQTKAKNPPTNDTRQPQTKRVACESKDIKSELLQIEIGTSRRIQLKERQTWKWSGIRRSFCYDIELFRLTFATECQIHPAFITTHLLGAIAHGTVCFCFILKVLQVYTIHQQADKNRLNARMMEQKIVGKSEHAAEKNYITLRKKFFSVGDNKQENEFK